VVPNAARLGAVVRRELAAARERRTGGMAGRLLLSQQTITDHVAAGLEPAELGARVLATLGEAFGWTYGALWRPDEAAGVLRCATSWHAPSGGQRAVAFAKASQDLTFAPGWGLPGRVWGFPPPAVDPDLALESTPRARWADRAKLRSAVAFPLALADRFEGVIEFLAPDIHEPDAEVAALFATVGGQLAQYLAQHRLSAETGGRDRAQAWLDATAAIVVVLDRDGRVEHANRRARTLLGRDVAGLDWFDGTWPGVRACRRPGGPRRALAGGDPEHCEHAVPRRRRRPRDRLGARGPAGRRGRRGHGRGRHRAPGRRSPARRPGPPRGPRRPAAGGPAPAPRWLMPRVGLGGEVGEGAAGAAEQPVEPDAGAVGEEFGGDSCA
jgi:PAS domain-containing protein